MFTCASRWAETGVVSNAIDTRGSVKTRVIQTVIRQRYTVRRLVFPTYTGDHNQTLSMAFKIFIFSLISPLRHFESRCSKVLNTLQI